MHKFILGYNNQGILLLILSIFGYLTICLFVGYFFLLITCFISLIEGIVYLTKSDFDFYNQYIRHKRPWF
ncbi:hypothetical protein P3875_10225 [Myroides sp. JBRI-B21084]|uniref:hypothetical protein n=1 Tax=Myroides sp. JBRI-B21084 TaxID=3119977 RepID=UPI0026E364B5|nr:hypothetical protein [Paenimyroides cloacae]WKW47670.1 hypothetical protein P3875_10225 [Paenimyroides cloacae]